MLRHPGNTNLHQHHADTFEGLPVMVEKGPFIREYLIDLKRTIDLAIEQYPRVLAFRVDLRLPSGAELDDRVFTNVVISRFIASFKAKIQYNREKAREQSKRAHLSKVRYVWTREQGQRGRPHYHLLILLNRDAFYSVGRIHSEKTNIFRRMNEAWASALRVPVDQVDGLVEVPLNATYRMDRNDSSNENVLPALFRRSSYLCKAATKVFGCGQHGFGCSNG